MKDKKLNIRAVRLKSGKILKGIGQGIHADIFIDYNLKGKDIQSCGWLVNGIYIQSYIPYN
ncbi:MAG: hypothetical protein ACXACF_01585 [Candidatus Hermodarchaeia archaeon]